MSRFILILVAFSILNQSIDLDYLTFAMGSRSTGGAHEDDIDSITEFVIEQIMDDDGYIPDNDDDSDGMPKNNGLEKFSWNPLCCQFFQKVVIIPTNKTDKDAQKAGQQVYPTCKGYSNIVSPPPDACNA
ncbi:hypothetical protein D3H65_15425 [Paraflavitalea soli]|uniref:Uncharacterized protein n=1 Tax=Paraflavitalea soli TaxID=2315862 RepID=A0A3B7MPP4_9BACT|nr:hypothetical protein [Paraflavitalea soli]AXY75289.1 hypothetical protein D3H65_15425 [Paraflavitalea soli]